VKVLKIFTIQQYNTLWLLHTKRVEQHHLPRQVREHRPREKDQLKDQRRESQNKVWSRSMFKPIP